MNQSAKKHFCDEETFTLINIWGEQKFLKMFETCKKHNLIFTKISDEMKLYNFERSPREIKNKLNNLKQEYNKTKPKSGGEAPTWKFFDKLNFILGAKDKYKSNLGEDSFIEEYKSDTIETTNPNAKFDDCGNLYEEVQYLEDETEIIELQSSCSTPSIISESNSSHIEDASGSNSKVCSTSKRSKKRKSDDVVDSLIGLSEKNQNILERLLKIEERRESREEKEAEQNQKVTEAMIRFLEFNSK